MTELDHRSDHDLEQSDREPVPVDLPDQRPTVQATVTAIRHATTRPIVPAWFRSREQRREVFDVLRSSGLWMLGFHGIRIPLYVVMLTLYTPRGMWRIARDIQGVVFDAEGHPLRKEAIAKKDAETYLKLQRERNKIAKRRSVSLTIGIVALTTACVFVTVFAPLLVQVAAGLLLVSLFGKVGAPADRPVISSALVGGWKPPKAPSSDLIITALRNMGIAKLAKEEIVFAEPVALAGLTGWQCELDLPLGVTAVDVAEERQRLSSALRRPRGCVWPEAKPEIHDGRLVLYVSKYDVSKMQQPPWPLLKSGQADVFKPLPFGTDVRGRKVALTLLFDSLLVGAKSRVGKTFSARVLGLGLALDPYCELRVFDFKGQGDWLMFEPVCHAFAQGQSDTACELTMDTLREMKIEIARRADFISKLPRDLVPEGKITPEIVRKYPHLKPIAVIIDECQYLFTHEEYKTEAQRLCEHLNRVGPAAGVIFIFCTQRPDKGSLPTGISANTGKRFCLRVMGQVENDMILGTSKYSQGVRATMFTPSDLGIGYLVGDDDEPAVVRSYYIDHPEAAKIVERARKIREAAGTLSGMAVGEAPPSTERVDPLVDLRTVFATCHVEKIWSETAVEQLTKLRPGVYTGWTPEALSAALKHQNAAQAVRPRDAWINGVNRNGYHLKDVQAALNAREIEQ